MKTLLAILALGFTTSSFAIDAKATMKSEYKSPKSSRMVCEGRTCSCPEDTVLDQGQMSCLKCDDSLILDVKNRTCTDPSFEKEVLLQDVRSFQGATLEEIKAQDSIAPTTCEISTMVNGKFKNCQCSAIGLAYDLSSKGRFHIMAERKFNIETQKCERSSVYTVSVDEVSCSGPRERDLDSLKKLKIADYKYDSPGMSLNMCGATDAAHVFKLKSQENEVSALDAIFLTTQILLTGKVEKVIIDPASLNY